MRKEKLRSLTESAILVAFASILSFMKIWEAPLGGAVTVFSMTPIIVLSYRRGVKWGLLGAFCYSFIQLILGLSNLSYIPSLSGVILGAVFDYVVPFTVLGLAGAADILPFKSTKIKIASGAMAVCILRFLSHFIIGSFIWYDITKALDWNEYVHTVGPIVYSFVYNITYLLPETVICVLGTVLIPNKLIKAE